MLLAKPHRFRSVVCIVGSALAQAAAFWGAGCSPAREKAVNYGGYFQLASASGKVRVDAESGTMLADTDCTADTVFAGSPQRGYLTTLGLAFSCRLTSSSLSISAHLASPIDTRKLAAGTIVEDRATVVLIDANGNGRCEVVAPFSFEVLSTTGTARAEPPYVSPDFELSVRLVVSSTAGTTMCPLETSQLELEVTQSASSFKPAEPFNPSS